MRALAQAPSGPESPECKPAHPRLNSMADHNSAVAGLDRQAAELGPGGVWHGEPECRGLTGGGWSAQGR